MADISVALLNALLDDWDLETVNASCLESQRRRQFIHYANAGKPFWAYESRRGDGDRFVRNTGAAPAKAKARFPFVEPLPHEQ